LGLTILTCAGDTVYGAVVVTCLAIVPLACLAGLIGGWLCCWRGRRLACVIFLLAPVLWVAVAVLVALYGTTFLSTIGAADAC